MSLYFIDKYIFSLLSATEKLNKFRNGGKQFM